MVAVAYKGGGKGVAAPPPPDFQKGNYRKEKKWGEKGKRRKKRRNEWGEKQKLLSHFHNSDISMYNFCVGNNFRCFAPPPIWFLNTPLYSWYEFYIQIENIGATTLSYINKCSTFRYSSNQNSLPFLIVHIICTCDGRKLRPRLYM